MHINYKTYQDLSQDIKKFLPILPDNIDIIVGIPRSGMIPAYMLGFLLNLPVISLDEFLSNGILENTNTTRILKKNHNKKKRVLMIDDSLFSGNALNKAKQKINNLQDHYDILWAVCYVANGKENDVDFYAETVSMPRFFQWNYLNHQNVSKACYDIDGVLCHDPTEEENDDGEKYIHFLKNARPLFIPSYEIYALVTSRLEKYRPQTEEWLKKNNVKYKKLYMLDLKSKEERIKMGAHGHFKAKIYNKLNKTTIFYESNPKQAAQIAELTKKPVFCVETDRLYLEGVLVDNKIISKSVSKKYPRWIIKLLCLFVFSSKKRKNIRQKYMKARR